MYRLAVLLSVLLASPAATSAQDSEVRFSGLGGVSLWLSDVRGLGSSGADAPIDNMPVVGGQLAFAVPAFAMVAKAMVGTGSNLTTSGGIVIGDAGFFQVSGMAAFGDGSASNASGRSTAGVSFLIGFGVGHFSYSPIPGIQLSRDAETNVLAELGPVFDVWFGRAAGLTIQPSFVAQFGEGRAMLAVQLAGGLSFRG